MTSRRHPMPLGRRIRHSALGLLGALSACAASPVEARGPRTAPAPEVAGDFDGPRAEPAEPRAGITAIRGVLISVQEPTQLIVAGLSGIEALDLASGAVKWSSTEATYPISLGTTTLVALAIDRPTFRARLVGFSPRGVRTFRSEAFAFGGFVPGTIHDRVQPDGSHVVSWSDPNPCPGVGFVGCGRRIQKAVRIEANTGRAIASTASEVAGSLTPTCGADEHPGLAEIPGSMRALAPIAAPLDANTECQPPNPFLFRGAPALVARTNQGGALFRVRSGNPALDSFSLGSFDRWRVTAEGEHLAVFSTTPKTDPATQRLRVYALASGRLVFEGIIPLAIDGAIAVAGANVLYIHHVAHRRALASTGATAWTHDIAMDFIDIDRPSSSR